MLPKANQVRKSLSQKVKEIVKHYPSVYKQPVQWGEQDMFGHVNNVWYLRYTETARFAHLHQSLKQYLTPVQCKDFERGTGQGIIIKSVKLDYKMPATYPDNLILATRISMMGKDEYTQDTLIVSEASERIVCKTTSIVVGYDYHLLKKTELAQEYHDCFASESHYEAKL
jgi:acyl-CoA thioester hydrolase